MAGGTKKHPKLKRYKSPTPSLKKQRQVNRANAETARALRRTRKALAEVGKPMHEEHKPGAFEHALSSSLRGLGVPVPGGESGDKLVRLTKVPYLAGKATVEDPAGVAKGNVKTTKDMIFGLPGAAAKILKNPVKGTADTAKDYAKDLERRYGPVVEGKDEKFVKRVKKEGFVQEALDAAAVAAPEGRILGAGLKTTGRGRHFMERPRPKLRSSGGKAKSQDLSANAFKVAGQRAKDATRKKVQARRVKQAAKHEHRVDALVAEAHRRGEVSPVRLKRARKKQHREVAKSKSRAVQGMKTEQAREIHRGAAKDISKLSKRERLGLKYAVQLGVRTPEQARQVLRDRLEQIAANGKRPPRVLRKTNDEYAVIESILRDPDSVFTPKLAQTVEGVRVRQARTAASDPTLAPAQVEMRAWQPVAIHYGMERLDGETPEGFISRVKERADEDGITNPGYFPSQKRPMQRFSDYAVGGTHAAKADKAYTGALFRTGREDVTQHPLLDAMARNVKRKFNWGHVAATFEEHSFDWSRGKTLSQLRDELDERGIDPNSVGFWNPGKFRDNRAIHEHDSSLDTGMGEEPSVGGIDRAVDDAGFAGDEIAGRVESQGGERGWVAVPRGVFDEVHADTRPSGAVGRSLDVLKGKQSRFLLGSLNLPWLQFQIASNALLTGLAKTGPADFVKAQVWWRKLDPEMRDAVEPWVGVGHFTMDVQQTRMGAAMNNRLVNAYRAWKQTPFARKLGKANPLDALFRADNAQNNAFRKAVLYSQVKRDAYRRMGRNMGQAHALQARLVNTLKLGPKQQIEAILKDRKSIERHAQYVNDWLGDYVTYTAKERRWLARNVMFYGFLRYSLTFAFYTLPTKHPIMAAITANLGQLQSEEVRTLLGGDELPFSFGKFYFTDADGQLKQIDLARMNPAANSILSTVGADIEGGPAIQAQRLVNMLPPLYQLGLDYAYGKSSFSGKPIKVKGETNYDAANRKDPLALEESARFALERGLRLFYPYRLAETLSFDGEPQGDDTLLWDPRPTQYKDKDILKGIAKTKRFNDKNNTLLNEVIPFVPKRSRDPDIARGIRERNQPKKSKRRSSSGASWVDELSGDHSSGGQDKGGSWVDRLAK